MGGCGDGALCGVVAEKGFTAGLWGERGPGRPNTFPGLFRKPPGLTFLQWEGCWDPLSHLLEAAFPPKGGGREQGGP